MSLFEGIVGHQEQKSYLVQAIEGSRLAHGYGFFGPDQIGKKMIALALASELAETMADLMTIRPENGSISVEVIRGARERLHMSTLGGGYKVLIVDGADAMTVAAQNALLKILEEPKGKTLIVLVSSRKSALLETIISRIVPLRFFFVSEVDVRSCIEARAENVDEILEFAPRRPGRAIELIDDELRGAHKVHQSEAATFIDGPLIDRMRWIQDVCKAKETDRIHTSLRIWQHLLRERLLASVQESQKSSLGFARALTALVETEEAVYHNVNKQLALERFARAL